MSSEHGFRHHRPSSQKETPAKIKWSRKYESFQPRSILKTDGGYIVVGKSDSSGVVAKISGNGDIVWRSTYGQGTLYAITRGLDSGYLVAGTRAWSGGDRAWVMKINQGGEKQWENTFQSDKSQPAILTATQISNKGYILGGRAGPFSGNLSNFLLAISPTGKVKWRQTFGQRTTIVDLASSGDGGFVYVSVSLGSGGSQTVSMDFQGTMRWTRTFESATNVAVDRTSDGGYVFSGGSPNLIKTTRNGDIQWERTYEGTSAGTVIQTNDGGYVFIEYTQLQDDRGLRVVKVNSSGARQWKSEILGQISKSSFYDIIETHGSDIIIAGSTITGKEQRAGWIMKLAPTTSAVSDASTANQARSTVSTRPSNEGQLETTSKITPLPKLNEAPSNLKARSPTSLVMLDQARERVGAAVIEGNTYVVYRYQNLLPYASGYEVFSSNSRVTDESTIQRVAAAIAAQQVLKQESVNKPGRKAGWVASKQQARAVLRKVAWRRATSDFRAADRKQLQRIQRTTSQIDQLVSTPLSALNRIVGALDWMKNHPPAWSIATSTISGLRSFDKLVRTLRNELRAWHDSAERLNENVQPTLASVTRIQQGKPVDYAQTADRVNHAAQSLKQLETQSAQLHDRLIEAAEASEGFADELSGVSIIGNNIVQPFRDLGSTIRSFADRVAQFRDLAGSQHQKLTSVKQAATSEESRLMSNWESRRERITSRWENRRGAELKVNGTVGGVVLIGLLILGFLSIRSSSSDREGSWFSGLANIPTAILGGYSVRDKSSSSTASRDFKRDDSSPHSMGQKDTQASPGAIAIPFTRKSVDINEIVAIGFTITAILIVSYIFVTVRDMIRYNQDLGMTQPFVIQLFFLVLMILLAGYLIRKGIELTPDLEKIGLLLLPTGAILLVYLFRVTDFFTSYLAGFGMHFILRVLLISGLIVVGVRILNTGIELTNQPNFTGISLSVIGVIMLLLSVYRANQVVVTDPRSDTILLNLIFLLLMITISGFLVSKGVFALSDR